SSATLTPVSVTLPLLVTVNRYRTVCPAVSTRVGVAVFVTLSAGCAEALTTNDALSGSIGVPDGSVPDTVAVSAMCPASRSAWVTVAVAVHVLERFGASWAMGQSTEGAGSAPGVVTTSSTAMFEMVTLPVLVTVNEYVTLCPTESTISGLADLV